MITDPIFARVFCARIRAARRARRLSQAELARRLGVSRAAYARYEAHTPLPIELAADFAKLTGAALEKLFA